MDGRNRVVVRTDKENMVKGEGVGGHQSGEVKYEYQYEYGYKYKVLSLIWIYRIWRRQATRGQIKGSF